MAGLLMDRAQRIVNAGDVIDLGVAEAKVLEVADDRTGLFEVEVQLDNRDRLLRAGMVATAKLVTNRLLNYRLPDSAVLFRRGAAYVFLVERQLVDVDAMFWTVGQTEAHRVRRVEVADWTEQGTDIIIPTDSASPWDVVLRGQRRLTDGQWVRVVDYQAGEATAAGDQRMTELTSRLPGGDSRTHESQQQSN